MALATAREGAAERGDDRAGGENLPAHGATAKAADDMATTAISGGKASKGRETSRGSRGSPASNGRWTTGETTMNPRVVSRCKSADRIDEEKAGEVV